MSRISFVPKEHKEKQPVTPSIRFEEFDGDMGATIYIDHIAVAYFCTITGGICLLDLETGPYNGGDQSADVAYLKERGFKLTKTRVYEHKEGKYYNYRIQVS